MTTPTKPTITEAEFRLAPEDIADEVCLSVDYLPNGYTLTQSRSYLWGDDRIVVLGELNFANHWDDEEFDEDCKVLEQAIHRHASTTPIIQERDAALERVRELEVAGEACPFCPDWTAWEKDLKKAATRNATPVTDEQLDIFRQALADVHCKSSSQERDEVEYRLQRFGAKMWRSILARLDAAEAHIDTLLNDTGESA